MQTYTFAEFEDAVKETGYKFIALYTTSNKQLIPYNNATKPTVSQRVDEIKKRLKSPSLPDGIYIVRAKSYQSKDGVYDEFPIQKGNGETKKTLKDDAPIKAERNPEVTSYKEVLKLQNRITELTFELSALQKEYDALEEKYDDKCDELEELKENPPQLAEGEGKDFLSRAGDWLQQSITMVSPLIDKHFELKELALKNETARLMMSQNKVIQQPVQKEVQPMSTRTPDPSFNFVVDRIKKFLISIGEQDPEKYEPLAQIFRDADGLDDFYNKIQAHDENTFNDLIQFINSK